MAQGMTPIKTTLRTPPHDTDAEKAFLGSILLRSQSIPDIADMIDPDSFYSGKNSIVSWKAGNRPSLAARPGFRR